LERGGDIAIELSLNGLEAGGVHNAAQATTDTASISKALTRPIEFAQNKMIVCAETEDYLEYKYSCVI
jgi:hypothetical protein